MMMRNRAAAALIFLALPLALSPVTAAATFHTDDFSAAGDAQQWEGGSVTGTTVTNAGGFLKIDSTGGFLASFNQRTDWSGDFTALAPAGNLLVRADLMSSVGSEPLTIRFVLFGDNGSRWTSTTEQALPADGVWRNYAFSLGAAALTRVAGAGSHAAMIGAVERVMFRHDPDAPSSGGTNVDGTLNLDNIQLTSVPEPAAGALAAFALTFAAYRGAYRRWASGRI